MEKKILMPSKYRIKRVLTIKRDIIASIASSSVLLVIVSIETFKCWHYIFYGSRHNVLYVRLTKNIQHQSHNTDNITQRDQRPSNADGIVLWVTSHKVLHVRLTNNFQYQTVNTDNITQRDQRPSKTDVNVLRVTSHNVLHVRLTNNVHSNANIM